MLLLYCLLAVGVAGGEVDVIEVLQTLYIFFSFFLELVVISSSRVLNFMMWLSIGFLSFFFWATPHSLWNLSSPTRDRTRALTVQVWGPNQGPPPALVFLPPLYWASTQRVGTLVLKFMSFSFEICSWIFFIPSFRFLLFYERPGFLMLGLNSSAEFPLLFHLFCSVQEVSSVFSSSLSYLIFNTTVFLFQ